ncbi:MAG: LCP family protein [Clostridia bacterium]|nr:LCP family protein [Clostridia bacterium]
MNKKKTVFLWCFLAISLLAGGLLLSKAVDPSEPSGTASEAYAEETGKNGEKGYFRLLVAGTDRTTQLCDVLLLLSLNRDTGEIWGLQLPRDTYAAYSSGSYRKLNGAANALGGMDELCAFLEESLGVGIDRYLSLSPDALRKGVDAVGGVDVWLPKAMNYEDPAQGLSIHLPAGTQHLDGSMAEQFVRYRSGYTRGDLDRMDAQKSFLSALYRKVKEEMTLTGAVKLAISLLGTVETNLTLPDITLLAESLFSAEAGGMFLTTAPGEEATATKSGASYFVLSAPGMEELLREHFGAREGGFDPNRVYLNQSYAQFQEIYRRKISYGSYSLTE